MAEQGALNAVSASGASALKSCVAALQVQFPRLAEVMQHPAPWWREVLGVVRFDDSRFTRPAFIAPEDIPIAQVHTPLIAGADAAMEIWRVSGPMQSGQIGHVRYRHNGRLLFASLSLQEREFAPKISGDPAQALRAASETAYRELFGTLETLQFAHPLRIWNFIPAINGDTATGERYWHFNQARQDVFLGLNRSIAGNVPAASAVGAAATTPLTIYCIAGRCAPIPLENPRQRSAWAYPPQYGPRSPTFSRACLDAEGAQTLFISGTSSIVGHETTHAGDAREQTRETVRNLRAMVVAANERAGATLYAMRALHYKVYVRRPEDQSDIEQALRGEIFDAPAMYLQADICRRDLSVEIEAVGTAVSG